jgi:hypothetical protein
MSSPQSPQRPETHPGATEPLSGPSSPGLGPGGEGAPAEQVSRCRVLLNWTVGIFLPATVVVTVQWLVGWREIWIAWREVPPRLLLPWIDRAPRWLAAVGWPLHLFVLGISVLLGAVAAIVPHGSAEPPASASHP